MYIRLLTLVLFLVTACSIYGQSPDDIINVLTKYDGWGINLNCTEAKITPSYDFTIEDDAVAIVSGMIYVMHFENRDIHRELPKTYPRFKEYVDYMLSEMDYAKIVDNSNSTQTYRYITLADDTSYLAIYLPADAPSHMEVVLYNGAVSSCLSTKQAPNKCLISNPSFEGVLTADTTSTTNIPIDWQDCGSKYFPHMSTVDIHTSRTRLFDDKVYPTDGACCLGLAARKDGSWEAVSQTLPTPLASGTTYTLHVDVRTNRRISLKTWKALSLKPRPYSDPMILEVYGSQEVCDMGELLFESDPIKNTKWETIRMQFYCDKSYSHLMIRARLADTRQDEHGYLLVDNLNRMLAHKIR